MKNLKILIFIILYIVHDIQCLNILGICPSAYRSHHLLFFKIMRNLAEKGHNITFVAHKPALSTHENITEIVLHPQHTTGTTLTSKYFFEYHSCYHYEALITTSAMGHTISKSTLEHPTFQEFLKTDQKFDIIILEYFLNEALFGLTHHFNCPLILLSTMPASAWLNKFIGNQYVSQLAYVPTMLTKYPTAMNFLQRIGNVFSSISLDIHIQFFHIPRQEKLYRKHFPEGPELQYLMQNEVSLIFANSHPSITGSRPSVPALVEIGGIHVEEPEPLPQDLQEILDSANNGVIYFSLGTFVQSEDLPPHIIEAILKTFSKLTQTVLWKISNACLEDMPDNVIIRKWFPQNSVLARPNVKLFMTHGGLLSIMETVYFGVPILGFPIFGDQITNVKIAEENGFGVFMEINDITEELLKEKIQEVLHKPKYITTVKDLSSIMRNPIVKPIDVVDYWAKYVAEYKGTTFIRVRAMDLHWIQLYCLDIIAVGVFLCITIYFFLKRLEKKILVKKMK